MIIKLIVIILDAKIENTTLNTTLTKAHLVRFLVRLVQGFARLGLLGTDRPIYSF